MSKFFEISVIEADKEGNRRTLSLRVNPDNVMAAIKQPLQPSIICMLGSNLMTQDQLPDEIDGLTKMETFEGGTAYVNPAFLSFYYTAELGKYTLIFPGGTQVAVRQTGAELKRMLEGASSIEI